MGDTEMKPIFTRETQFTTTLGFVWLLFTALAALIVWGVTIETQIDNNGRHIDRLEVDVAYIDVLQTEVRIELGKINTKLEDIRIQINDLHR